MTAAGDLPAGRELDALIAEKVMGLVVKAITVIDGRGPREDVGTVSPRSLMSDGRMGVAAEAIPAYSTDLAAAGKVLARLIRLSGDEIDIHAHAADDVGGVDWVCGWNCDGVFFAADDERFEEAAEADTLPLVICRAALKAVEEVAS